MDQNVDFSSSDQIQTPQYPEIHPPSQEINDEVFHANHSAQYKEYPENSSKKIASSNSNQEKEGPPQDFDIRQLIREEWCVEVCEEQKQNMEHTILELVEIYRQKELLCIHDNVDDLIESALNSKLFSINSQCLNKEKQEVKNVVEQPAERGTLHAITHILSTKEPEYSFSMGYKHPNTTPEMESDEIIKSGVEELVPIQSECKVTSEDESKCDMPIQDQSSSVFMTFSNPLFKDNDDLTSSDDESLFEEDVPIEESKVHSNPLFDDDEINSDELKSHVESNFVESPSNHDALIDSKKSILLRICCMIIHLHDRRKNVEIANTIVKSFPSSLIPIQDNDSQREEIDIVTNTDEVLPPGVENDDDSEGEIIPRPPPEPPDAEFNFELDAKILVVMNTIVEFDVSNDENDDYFPFISEKAEFSVIATVEAQSDDKLMKEELMGLLIAY
uniref:Uncharacterized protein n=1 Tax=Tanacetum cinerariifolium TaxID=118510 RepID=A0A699HQ78_TANCI|nr:hypothetical protein [Tanacetum cinerariifolium]